jgi:myo-inositol-1-phosphate synthase
MDFKNMLERERLESKKVSKTQAVTSNLTGSLAGKVEDKNVHIGPSDYVAWLDDRKWAYVRLEGRAFGDVPLNLEYKLEVWDSRTRPASSSTRSAPPRSPRTAASVARSSRPRPT